MPIEAVRRTFGYTADDPIRCFGPSGETLYISTLRCPHGHSVSGLRLGSHDGKCTDPKTHRGSGVDNQNQSCIVDCYELRCSGGEYSCKLYFDIYHPHVEDQSAPVGLSRVALAAVGSSTQLNTRPSASAECLSKRRTLHELILEDWKEDLPIAGGHGQSRSDPIVIGVSDPEVVARTQMHLLKYLGFGRRIYWRRLGRQLLDNKLPGIEQFKIETVELTPEKKITQTENYYFDVSALVQNKWLPICSYEPCEFLDIRIPSEIGWLHFSRVIDKAICVLGERPAIEYSAPEIKATICAYSNVRDEIVDDIKSPIVVSEFEAVARTAAAAGPHIEPWPDPPFDGRCHKRYLKGGPTAEECIFIGLTVYKGHFISLHAAWARDEFIDSVANDWIRSALELFGRA